MRLDELQRTILRSSVDDWLVITCWGAGGDIGPSYLNAFSATESHHNGVVEHWLDHDSFGSRATYRPDVSIGLAWGLFDRDDERDFDWNHFPDRTCYPTLVDVLVHGNLVDRHVGLAVDGGRCYLPFPEVEYDSTDIQHPVLIAEWFPSDEIRLFRLLHELKGNSTADFDRFVGLTRLEVR